MKTVNPHLEERIKDWPREKQEEARKSLGEFFSGVMQSLKGNVRKAFVDQFLDTVGPVERFKLEFIADQIVAAKDSNRLRQKTLIGLAASFESGLKYAEEALKRGENPSHTSDAIHKIVLKKQIDKITR